MLRNYSFARLSIAILTLVMCLMTVGSAVAADPIFARMETTVGKVLLVFYPELAPNHVNNFVHLSRTGYFQDTYFHRVIPGFMIQGGDPNTKDRDPRNDGQGSPTLRDVLTDDELASLNKSLASRGYSEGLSGSVGLNQEFNKALHFRGTLSMARAADPNSAGSQFFICVDRAANLDNNYTVFGQAVTGMDVVDVIVHAELNPAAGQNHPKEPVLIQNIIIMEGTGDLDAEESEAWKNMDPTLKSRK